jgi:hypothetical protein
MKGSDMAHAGKGTRLDTGKGKHPVEKEATKAPANVTPRDARKDPNKQKKNQRDLGVQPDHRTDEMAEKGHGTFP